MESPSINAVSKTGQNGYQSGPLWMGPSRLTTIRTGKTAAIDSLLKTGWGDPSAIAKKHRQDSVNLSKYGFEGDEQTFHLHGGPGRAVLQYNAAHYPDWREELKNVRIKDRTARNTLLSSGGFGENIIVGDPPGAVPMDERTVCIGDLVGILDSNGVTKARMRITGPRMPCYKLNHRFGIPNMGQRTQESFRTGWFYSVETEGDVEINDQIVLLERPFPSWPVARTQYYLFKDPKNLDMIKDILASLGDQLLFDSKGIFQNRLTKGVEDMTPRLKGEVGEKFVPFRLRERSRQTDRVSEFVLERVEKIPEDSQEYMVAQSGSHIRLRFNVQGDNVMQLIRPYSVISGDSNDLRIGVALADNSRGGSSFLHQNLQIGDMLEASDRFANTFPLQELEQNGVYVFLAGGIGITAFLDHVRHCVKRKRRFHLHYMLRNASDYAFQGLIEEMIASASETSEQVHGVSNDPLDPACNGAFSTIRNGNSLAEVSVYIGAEGRRCNVQSVLSRATKNEACQIYVCGSEKLSNSVQEHAASLSIASSRLHFEQFTVDPSGDPFVAELVRSQKQVMVSAKYSLLDALREAGLDIPSSCEAGNCATCRVPVKCGKVFHKGIGLLEEEKAGTGGEESGSMLSCVSRGRGVIQLDL